MTQAFSHPLEAHPRHLEPTLASDQGRDISATASQEATSRAEARLRSGDYVRPDGQLPGAFIATDFLTRQLAHDENFQEPPIRDNFKPMADYAKAAKAATSGIDTAEENMAKQKWNALSDDQRKEIRKEMDALDKYTFDIYHKTPKPNTAELDKFESDLTQSVAPLELQRDQILHDVWKGLPEDTRRKILLRDEQTPKYKFVD